MAEYTYICKATKTVVGPMDPMLIPAGVFSMGAVVYSALYQFESLPDEGKKQVVKSVRLSVPVQSLQYTGLSLGATEFVTMHFAATEIYDQWDETITSEEYYRLRTSTVTSTTQSYFLNSFDLSLDTEAVGIAEMSLFGIYPDKGTKFQIRSSEFPGDNGHPTQVKGVNIGSARSANPPYLTIVCEDAIPTPTPLAPADNSYVDVTSNITFSWAYKDPAGNPQTAWQIFVRAADESEWTTLASGNNADTTFVLPPNSLTAKNGWQWKASTTNDQGFTGESAIATFNARPVPSATILRPKGSFVDASRDTLFEWSYFNPIGDAQAGFTMEATADGIAWTELASVDNSVSSYTVPANTLAYNITQWRLWVRNRQGIQSEAPAVASITVVAAPSVEIVSASRTPRPTVNWKATVQRGYQVQIGSHDSGPIYGTASSYTCPVYLPDGETEIRVRAVSQYGLWSQWATTTVNIVNQPGVPAHLNATATHRAALKWDGPPGEYTVLRDGKEIARVEGDSYTDELAVGRHTYQVRHAWERDYYTMSNEISVELRPRYPMIADLDGLDWLELRLSTTATPAANVSRSREVYFAHYSGRRLPVAETGGFDTETLTFSAAFRGPAEAKRLLALSGHKVCYKDPRGNIIIGTLEGLSGGMGRMYGELSGTIVATEETT